MRIGAFFEVILPTLELATLDLIHPKEPVIYLTYPTNKVGF